MKFSPARNTEEGSHNEPRRVGLGVERERKHPGRAPPAVPDAGHGTTPRPPSGGPPSRGQASSAEGKGRGAAQVSECGRRAAVARQAPAFLVESGGLGNTGWWVGLQNRC